MTAILNILIICSIAFTAYVGVDCIKKIIATNKNIADKFWKLEDRIDSIQKQADHIGRTQESLLYFTGQETDKRQFEIDRLEKLIRKSCHHAKIVYLDFPDGEKKSRCFNCGEYDPKVKNNDV